MRKYIVLVLCFFCGCQQKPNIQNQTRGLSIEGIWKLQVTPDFADTLKLISSDNSYYYSCEENYTYDIKYFVSADTLYLDEYDYVSNIDTSKGKEISSKWKLIIIKDKLKPIYIAHKYKGGYEEVSLKVYDSIGEFNLVK